jgi:hypothetical protein
VPSQAVRNPIINIDLAILERDGRGFVSTVGNDLECEVREPVADAVGDERACRIIRRARIYGRIERAHV